MRIDEVLAKVDKVKPNQYDDAIKIDWLSTLDGKIMEEVIKTHELPVKKIESINEDTGETETIVIKIDTDFNGYDKYSMNTELLIDGPYADIYENYIYAMIDFANQETERYNNSMNMFNARFKEFENYWNRKYLPNSRHLKLI